MAARPGPDLAAWGYAEREFVARGTAVSWRGGTPPDGRWSLEVGDEADFATRVAVRRPVSPGRCSGTVVVEWLNVSSGSDAAPEWTYLADEVVRRGHAWVGVSAQYAGVEGGSAAVAVAGVRPTGIKGRRRYAALHHPGDAYAASVFASVAAALDDALDDAGGPLADLVVDVRLAVGESQSAYALTSFVNGVHPRLPVFDGFLLHSRGGAALPLGEPGTAADPRAYRGAGPVRLRDDLDAPVLVVQTETDLFGELDYLPARQPDAAALRVWEVAGTAHADRYSIGEHEATLGCPRPVNRGQQAYVLRAALRRLEEWVRGGDPAPAAAPLEVADGALVRDEVGNSRGGVRTPAVDAPVQLLRGDTEPGASYLCRLFGSSLPVDPTVLRGLYADRAAYLAAYERAADAAVAAGFVLPEDRAELLTEARPDLVDAAHATP